MSKIITVWHFSEEWTFYLMEESRGVSQTKEAWQSLGERSRPGVIPGLLHEGRPPFSTAQCPDLGGPLSSIPSNPSVFISSNGAPLPLASSVLSLQTSAQLPLLYLLIHGELGHFATAHGEKSGAVASAFSPPAAVLLGPPRGLHCTGHIQPESEHPVSSYRLQALQVILFKPSS